MTKLEEIEMKLEALRVEWRDNPVRRPIIERQARMLENAKNMILKKGHVL